MLCKKETKNFLECIKKRLSKDLNDSKVKIIIEEIQLIINKFLAKNKCKKRYEYFITEFSIDDLMDLNLEFCSEELEEIVYIINSCAFEF